MKTTAIPLATALAAVLVLVACEPRAPQPGATAIGAAPPASAVPPPPVKDPSVPSADVAIGAQRPAAPTAQDSASARPMADLSQAEETHSMPKPNQANNHSSTALDRTPASAPRP